MMAALPKLLQKTSTGLIVPLQVICFHKAFPSDSRLCSIISPRLRRKLQDGCSNVQACSFSTDSEAAKFLTQSTMLVQDGTDIEELPILIRRATRDSFPFSSHTYCGERVHEEVTEAAVSFSQMLQDCESVQEVFRLLETPSDTLDGYSASFALKRLHTLKHLNRDWSQIHSFIRSTIMGTLYGTVRKDIEHLPNAMLISLVQCYLAAEGFPSSCVDSINNEIQVRLGDGVFSLPELLALSQVLQQAKDMPQSPSNYPQSSSRQILSESKKRLLNYQSSDSSKSNDEHFDSFSSMVNAEYTERIKEQCKELHTNIWAHLALRYTETDGESLPVMLHSLSKDSRPFVNLLEKRLKLVWTDLSVQGATQCLDALVQLRMYSPGMLGLLGRWSYVNLHLFSREVLLTFLNTFLHFNFLDKNLITVAERCLSKKGAMVDTDVMAMCVEYCRANNYLSPLILNTAANHFTRHWRSYEPLQLYAVLRAFGQLNYLPQQSPNFMSKVEQCITERFNHVEPDQLLEILGSFTFINVTPTNFHKLVTSDYFFKKVGDLQNPKKSSALRWLKVLRHAWAHTWHSDIKQRTDWVMGRKGKNSVYCHLDSQMIAIRALKETLEQLIGLKYCHIVPFYGCFAIYLDKSKVPLEIQRTESGLPIPKGKVDTKIVILLRSADDFTVNTGQLLGAQESRKRQLTELGFTTVELRAGEFLYNNGPSYLRKQLKSQINFTEVDRLGLNKIVDEKEVHVDCLDDDGFSSDDDLLCPTHVTGSFVNDGVTVADSGLLNIPTKNNQDSEKDT